jgi:fission process protein 1
MDKSTMKDTPKTEENYDIFRDSPLRYLGYANEVGESFRYQIPKLVIPSYAVAFAYCTADAVTSGYDMYGKATKMGSPTAKSDSLVSAVDTLIWQSLASVTIPGATINMVVKASRFAVTRSPVVLTGALTKWLPTVTGLASVPLIISPIDHAVDFFMDSTFRTIRWTDSPPATTAAEERPK